ncbi:DEAD/DEAH box helicase [Saprospiraceae bacterium]|nr:DEAD/DEAH box helicase [Saprospiraceae bacterium]MDG1435328.1 DEAD/DEAH box helicase [Saprospiraceae bacterium]
MSFTKLGLPATLVAALADQQYQTAYPIQAAAIPAILDKKNILGIAKTGSGKTASFVLPILSNLQGTGFTKNRHPLVLVLVPTRELAVQVNEVFKLFRNALSDHIRTLAVYGGVSINPQMIAMNGVQILVATPGRLLDLIDSKAVHLSNVKTLVLDEADKMLNMGFKEEMNRILGFLPKERQNLLFSATLNPDLDSLSVILMKDPVVIKIESEQTSIDQIKQSGYFVLDEKKGPLLRYLIKSNNLTQVLVFTSSSYSADNVANKLRKNGVKAGAIHGKKSQSARNNVLNQFKAGNLPVLVATDLLSRGIDIAFLPCVINYELPRSPKDYVHRIGRTGRADNSGLAISFVNPESVQHFKVILKKGKQWIDIIDSSTIDLQGY